MPRRQALWELAVLAVFLACWLALPQALPWLADISGLRFGPGWDLLYAPCLLLAAACLLPPAVNLRRPRWVRFHAVARLAAAGAALAVLSLSLAAGRWVVAVDAAGAAAERAARINRSFGMWLEVASLVCLVQLIVDLRRLLRRGA